MTRLASKLLVLATYKGKKSLLAVKQGAARKGLTCKMKKLHTDRLETPQHYIQSLHRRTEIQMSVKYKTACARTISSLNKKCKLSHFGVYPPQIKSYLTSYA